MSVLGSTKSDRYRKAHQVELGSKKVSDPIFFQHVNVGSGTDVTIREVAEMVCQVVGFEGKIATDTSKPDGTPRKLLNSGNLRDAGWHPQVPLNEGLARTYAWWTKRDALVGADS